MGGVNLAGGNGRVAAIRTLLSSVPLSLAMVEKLDRHVGNSTVGVNDEAGAGAGGGLAAHGGFLSVRVFLTGTLYHVFILKRKRFFQLFKKFFSLKKSSLQETRRHLLPPECGALSYFLSLDKSIVHHAITYVNPFHIFFTTNSIPTKCGGIVKDAKTY